MSVLAFQGHKVVGNAAPIASSLGDLPMIKLCKGQHLFIHIY